MTTNMLSRKSEAHMSSENVTSCTRVNVDVLPNTVPQFCSPTTTLQPWEISGSLTNDTNPSPTSLETTYYTAHNITDDCIDSSLQLNFDYKRDYGHSSLPDVATFQQNLSAASLVESNYNSIWPHRWPRLHDYADFRKYLPVSSPVALTMPYLLQNQRDPKEWKTAQKAFQQHMLKDVVSSQSDSVLVSKKKPKLHKLFHCIRKQTKENSCAKLSRVVVQPVDLNSLALVSDPRFDYSTNLTYSHTASMKKPVFSAALYSELDEEPNIDLFHIKTELLVAALLNFFHPWTDIQCLWVKDLQSQLRDVLQSGQLRPRFTRILHLAKYKALLVLSEHANTLLRHRHTCFLHSIAAALQVNPNRILVLFQGRQNIHGIGIRDPTPLDV